MKKTSLLAAAAALAFSGASFAAGISPAGKAAGNAPASLNSAAVLYDQTAGNDGIGITSQNFETAFDAYDAMSADDFTVPKGTSWKVSEVMVMGAYFNGAGPATSANVTFYKEAGGLPGAVVKAYPNSAITADSAGSLTIKLNKALKLKKGKYFVSVQANMDFNVGGQWGWNGNTTQSGNPAAWQNPGDGFATGCTSWAVEGVCIVAGQGPDKAFALMGKAK